MPLSKLWAGSLVLLAAVSLPLQAASPVKVGSKIDIEGALLVALAAIIADRLFERLVQVFSQHAK
ncbi:hypothetical protein EYW98_16315 [Escherichia coli]|nr:hypothetical protein [Escherichia coli]EGO8378409.1 hypothetical protein [Escherichia coli]